MPLGKVAIALEPGAEREKQQQGFKWFREYHQNLKGRRRFDKGTGTWIQVQD